MCEDFEAIGIKPCIFLHVSVGSNIQPKKPVTMALPIPADSIQCGEIMILQGDDGDDLIDVTNDVSYVYAEHEVILEVAHFTL